MVILLTNNVTLGIDILNARVLVYYDNHNDF